MRGRTPFVRFLPACEGVGHAGRMLLVAQALRENFDGTIEFAGNEEAGRLFSEAGFQFHEIGEGFSLKRIIDRGVELYRSLDPDLLVWDGRFTVPISAEIAGLPFVSVLHKGLRRNLWVGRPRV